MYRSLLILGSIAAMTLWSASTARADRRDWRGGGSYRHGGTSFGFGFQYGGGRAWHRDDGPRYRNWGGYYRYYPSYSYYYYPAPSYSYYYYPPTYYYPPPAYYYPPAYRYYSPY